MAIYVYRCGDGHEVEVVAPMTAEHPTLVECEPGCPLDARRVFSSPQVTGLRPVKGRLVPPEGMTQREFNEHVDATGGERTMSDE